MKKNAASNEKEMNSTNENINGARSVDENEHSSASIRNREGESENRREETNSPNENTSRLVRNHVSNNRSNRGDNTGNTRRRMPITTLSTPASNTTNVLRRRRGDGGKHVYGGEKAAALSSNASRDDTMSTASITVGSAGTSAMGSGAMGYGSFNGRDRAYSRRNGGRNRNMRRTRSMFNRQLQLLLSVSGSSVILFLFFFLNIFAFTALMTGFASTIMLMLTLYNYANFVVSSPQDGALYDFLPSSLQEYLANTSLHDAMTSNDGFMENRWYLLYFIPGLTPEQVNSMVNRLPQRHRDMAHGPGGLARMILPNNYYRMIAPPNDRSQIATTGLNSMEQRRLSLIDTEYSNNIHSRDYDISQDNAHDPSLPVIIEHDEEEEGSEEENVTMHDAFHGLLQTARQLITGTDQQRLGLSEELESDVSYDDDEHENRVIHQDISWDDSRDSRIPTVGESGHMDEDGLVTESQTSLTRSRVGQSSSGEAYQYQDMSWDTQGSQFDIDDEHDDDAHRNERVHVELTVDLASEGSNDDASSDFGLDVTEDDFVGGMNNGQLQRLAGLIRLPFQSNRDDTEEEVTEISARDHVSMSRRPSTVPGHQSQIPLISSHQRPHPATTDTRVQSSGSNTVGSLPSTVMTSRLDPLSSLFPRIEENQDDEDQTQQTLEEQQEIEGDILNEAISTMMDNYTNSARNAVMDVTQNVIERIAPVIIRLGARLSSISAVGLLGIYSSSRIASPNHLMGINVSGRSLTNVNPRTERYIITGFASSLVLGAFSVGSAYIARSFVRRATAISREFSTELQDSHVDNIRNEEIANEKANIANNK